MHDTRHLRQFELNRSDRKTSNEEYTTQTLVSELKRTLMGWPLFVIRTRMELSHTSLLATIRQLRSADQLIPGPGELYQGIIPGIIHRALYTYLNNRINHLLRSITHVHKIPHTRQADWEQKLAEFSILAEQQRFTNSQGQSTTDLALSALRQLSQIAHKNAKTVILADVIQALSAGIAAFIAYPFLWLATMGISGALPFGQFLKLLRSAFLAYSRKRKNGGGEGGKGGGGDRMKMMLAMMYKGCWARMGEAVCLVVISSLAQWWTLRILQSALDTGTTLYSNTDQPEDAAQKKQRENTLAQLIIRIGAEFLVALMIDTVLRHSIGHIFEVISARQRVGMQGRDGWLLSGVFVRLFTQYFVGNLP